MRKLKKEIKYSLMTMVLLLVIGLQITSVIASTQYTTTEYDDEPEILVKAQVSIWAGPRAGGGCYMDQQAFLVKVKVIDDATVYEVHVEYNIQGSTVKDQQIFNGADSSGWVVTDLESYSEYEWSRIVVYADIEVDVKWRPDGGNIEWESLTPEVSYEAL